MTAGYLAWLAWDPGWVLTSALFRSMPVVFLGPAGSWGHSGHHQTRDKKKRTVLWARLRARSQSPLPTLHWPTQHQWDGDPCSLSSRSNYTIMGQREEGRLKEINLLQLTCCVGGMSGHLTTSWEDFQLILLLLAPAASTSSRNPWSCQFLSCVQVTWCKSGCFFPFPPPP